MQNQSPHRAPRFSRKALNFIILITIILIIIFSQLGQPGKETKHENSAHLTDKISASEAIDSVSNDKDANSPVGSIDLEKLQEKLTSLEQVEPTISSEREIDIETWNTTNGAKVFFVHAPEIPILDVRLVFDAGAARDKNLPGLANISNQLLSQGTEKLNVNELLEKFENKGIKFSHSAYRDMAVVGFRSLAIEEYMDTATQLISEIVGEPTFPEEHFKRLLSQYKLALERDKQSPSALISKATFNALYGAHPYGHNPKGNVESLSKIQRTDILTFHETYYVAKNLVIAIVGSVESNKAKEIAEALTQHLKPGSHAPNLPKPSPVKQQQTHIPYASNQTHIHVSTLSLDKSNPDFYALFVGNYILGGSGFASILNQEIRQKNGLSYSVGSNFTPMRSVGPFVAALQTQNKSADIALKLLLDNIKKFVETGPSKEQLDRVKQELTTRFPLRTASNSNVLGNVASIGFYNLPLDYLQTYNKKIAALTTEEVKKAMQQYITPEHFSIITLGKKLKEETRD